MLKTILINLFIITSIIACSSENNDSVIQNSSFSTTNLRPTEEDSGYSSQLIGSSSTGTTYSGSINIISSAQVLLNGLMVTPVKNTVILSATNAAVVLSPLIETHYIDTSGNLISLNIELGNTTCTPVSPDKIPLSVLVGDTGIRSVLLCDNNTAINVTWSVEDNGDGNAKFIFINTIKDELNNIISVTEVTYIISNDGEILDYRSDKTTIINDFNFVYYSA